MIVEKWKNLVFLAPSLSHSSLDFCLHIISLLASHSDNSAIRTASILPLSSKYELFWASAILHMRRLILSLQCPKTSLLHLRKEFLVAACFLYNLIIGEPDTSSFHTFPTIVLQLLSLTHATSKQKGLWAKLSS